LRALLALLLQLTAAAAPAPCASDRAAGALDFWLGEWSVVDPRGAPQGSNRIEKVLSGCAILEHWRDAGGGEGKSLFFLDRTMGGWRQVWITDKGLSKEKTQVLGFEGPGIRFQGRVRGADGVFVLDRTTLIPLPDGRVRQRIEQSSDDGKTWRAWEGLYARAASPPDAAR
jgi:hypothetical protein